MSASPNILLVMADQPAPQAPPCCGHPLAKAPHIAALANRSPVLGNAYTNFPLCAPSRASLLTGRYANSIPVWDNADELAASAPRLLIFCEAEGPRNRPTGINIRAVIDSGPCIRTLQIDYDDEVEFIAPPPIRS